MFKPVNYVQGRLVCRIRAKGDCMRGDCLKYLKRGWKRKEGGQRFLKGGGQAGSRGGCLKNKEVGLEPPYYDPIKTFTSNPPLTITFLEELSISTRVVQESNLNQILCEHTLRTLKLHSATFNIYVIYIYIYIYKI